jgi:cytochrome c556
MYGVIAVVSLLGGSAFSQLPDGQQHGRIMERKLETVHKVMEGIARSDFDQIKQKSQLLHLLSREAGWNVLVTPTYQQMSESFRATVNQLEQAAEIQNLDAVGLAYVKLSISCIECHRYARKEMSRVGMQTDPLKTVPRVGEIPRKSR